MTEKGLLPVGVEFEGVVHRDYELRPARVRDTVDVFDDETQGERAMKNPQFFAACLFAGRLAALGSIPKEEINPGLILDLDPEDYEELQAAATRLEQRQTTFRNQISTGAQVGVGADETGVQRGAGVEHAGAGGIGLLAGT